MNLWIIPGKPLPFFLHEVEVSNPRYDMHPVDSNKYERYGYAKYSHPYVPHGGNYLAKELRYEQ